MLFIIQDVEKVTLHSDFCVVTSKFMIGTKVVTFMASRNVKNNIKM
jgi:hypothetical protein